MKKFELSQEFIELNKLLKLMQWAESGGHANQLVENGEIKVNGEFEYRKRNKLRAGMIVEFGKLQVEIVEATGDWLMILKFEDLKIWRSDSYRIEDGDFDVLMCSMC